MYIKPCIINVQIIFKLLSLKHVLMKNTCQFLTYFDIISHLLQDRKHQSIFNYILIELNSKNLQLKGSLITFYVISGKRVLFWVTNWVSHSGLAKENPISLRILCFCKSLRIFFRTLLRNCLCCVYVKNWKWNWQ